MRKIRVGSAKKPVSNIIAGKNTKILTGITSTVSLLTFLYSSGVAGAGLYFDPAMVDGASVADLSRFEQAGNQQPDTYQVEVFLNQIAEGTRSVRFITRPEHVSSQAAPADNTGLMACLTRKDLLAYGVSEQSLPAQDASAENTCISPEISIPGARTTFKFSKMRLDISIPQARMTHLPQGWVPPEQWDDGINAALLAYNFSGSDNHSAYGDSQQNILNLISGLNLGAWRLRDSSTWHGYHNRGSQGNRWQHISTWAERAIIPWRSELTLGDSSSTGEVFDSVAFRGMQLATDDNMYPDGMRGYAPVIRGVAGSNARIIIRQHGNIVYQTFVAPGPFNIRDLYPVSSGGDLEVTVAEANGQSQVFNVPFSSLPVLQREGHLRYSLTAGQLRSSSQAQENTPAFAQGILQWGLPHNVTLYGGVQAAEHYRAMVLGTGINAGALGAVSADVTQANSVLADGSHHQGQSMRLMYARSVVATGTSFQLAAYRYSTRGFYTLQETTRRKMAGWLYDDDNDRMDAKGAPVRRAWSDYYSLYNNKHERLQATITQDIPGAGSLYLSATRQTYWDQPGAGTSLQLGYGDTLWHVNYNLAYSYSHESARPGADHSLSLSLSIPLDSLLPGKGDRYHSLTVNTNSSRNSNGIWDHQAGISGTALSANNLDWSVSQGYNPLTGNSGNASLSYQGGFGQLSAGYSYGQDYRQVNYALSAGMLLHRNGLTFGQNASGTLVLVAAPGAAHIPVDSATGVATDRQGYAIVPSASAYRQNREALDVSQLDDHTDIDNPVATLIPTKDAVVRAVFRTHTGNRVLMTLSYQGHPVPFGSMVTAGKNSAIVGDEGEVFLTGLPSEVNLTAQWGNRPEQQCSLHYHLPENANQTPLVRAQVSCQ